VVIVCQQGILGDVGESSFYTEKAVVQLPDSEVVARDGNAGIPFEELGSLAEVKLGSKLETEKKTKMTPGGQSGAHGRELVDETSRNAVLWGDVYGGWYAARGEKGGRWYEIRLKEIDDGKFRIQGMYNESEADYLVRVTDFLAKNGLLTEKVRVARKLNTMVVGDEKVEVEDWKKMVLLEAEKNYGKGTERYRLASEYINEVNLVLVERDLQVSERIRDLRRCRTKEEFEKVLGGVFKIINVVAEVKGTSTLPNTKPPERFDINNESDIRRYLGEWLPSQMGIYLARLRKLEMTNDYSHDQQWSLVGSEYDPQSFVGRGFVRNCTEEDYRDALGKSLQALADLLGNKKNYIGKEYRGLGLDAVASLLKEYAREMGCNVSDIGYDFISNNSYCLKDIGFPILSPFEWNKVRKKADTEFDLKGIEMLKETLKNFSLAAKLHAKFQGQFIASIPEKILRKTKTAVEDLLRLS